VTDASEVLGWAQDRLRKVNEAIMRLEELAAYYETWEPAKRNTAFGYELVNSVSPDSKCSE